MGLFRHLTVSVVSIALLSWGSPSAAQSQNFDKVEIKTVPVVEGVYMLVGEGGNIGVSTGKDGVFLIDDQFAPLTGKIQAAVAEISDQPLRFLLNTHWHADHSGGNENFGKAGAVIIAHDQVRKRLSTKQFIKAFGREIPASPAIALPIVTFGDTMTFASEWSNHSYLPCRSRSLQMAILSFTSEKPMSFILATPISTVFTPLLIQKMVAP